MIEDIANGKFYVALNKITINLILLLTLPLLLTPIINDYHTLLFDTENGFITYKSSVGLLFIIRVLFGRW